MLKPAIGLAIFLFLLPHLLFSSEFSQSDMSFIEASQAVKEKDYLKAINIFDELAKNGEHDAQYNLALLQKSGRGKPQDYKSALKWSWLALLGDIEQAEEIVEDMQDVLPDLTLNAVRKDVRAYLEDRAKSGDYSSILQMGKYFLQVPEESNYKDAYLWFLIAAAFQIEGAIDKRDNVEREIDSKDIVNIQENAAKIYEEIFNNLE